MSRVVLSIGSNLGDRLAYLSGAVAGLRRAMGGEGLLTASPVYETPPWGDVAQPSYLNAVVLVAQRDVTVRDWFLRARALEAAAGRVRDPARRFGPRTLDVDLIAAWENTGAEVHSADPELTLPHPRAHERAFVLRPWLTLDSGAELPGRGPVAGLLTLPATAADDAAMTLRSDLRLEFQA